MQNGYEICVLNMWIFKTVWGRGWWYMDWLDVTQNKDKYQALGIEW